MNENALWKEIEDLGWTRDHNYKRIGIQLTKTGRRKELYDFFREKKRQLYKVLDKAWDGTSDDRFDDLCSHIVGSGKAVFEAVIANPASCNDIDFKESFAYCFQVDDHYLDPSDYLLRLDHFIKSEECEDLEKQAAMKALAEQIAAAVSAGETNFTKFKGPAHSYDHPVSSQGWALSNIVNDLIIYSPHFPRK